LLRRISLKAIRLVNQALDDVDLEQADFRRLILDIARRLIPLGDRMYFLLSETFAPGGQEVEAGEQLLAERILEVFRHGQRLGQVRPDLPARWLASAAEALLFAAWEEVQAGNLAANAAADVLAATLLDGCNGS